MDTILQELNDFRKRFPKELVMFYPYPALKRAISKGEITLYRDDNGDIEGYLWLKDLKTKGVSRIEEIYSLRKGLGSIMMRDAKQRSKYLTIELKVLDFNERAINFYKKHGFEEVSRETGKAKNNITMAFIKESEGNNLNLF